MYCKYCGSYLDEGSNFCMYCGEPVIVSHDSGNVGENDIYDSNDSRSLTDEIYKEYGEEKIFNISGRVLKYDEKYVLFNRARCQITDILKEETVNLKIYVDSLKYSEHLYGNVFSWIMQSVRRAAGATIDCLMEWEIDEIDMNLFMNYIEDDIISELNRGLLPLKKLVNGIESDIQSKEIMKEIERNSRSRWAGIGFGISGAIKAQIGVGILNMATDAFRSIGDAVEDVGDMIKNRNVKNSFINDEIVRILIFNNAMNVFFIIQEEFFTILREYGKIYEINFNTQRIESRYNNYLKHINEKKYYDKFINNLYEGLLVNPYEVRYYAQLYNHIDRYSTELPDMARYFGMEYEYLESIEEYARDEMKKIDAEDEKSIDSVNLKTDKYRMLEKAVEGRWSLMKDIDCQLERLETVKDHLIFKEKLDELLENNKKELLPQIFRFNALMEQGKISDIEKEIENGLLYAEYIYEKHCFRLAEDIIKEKKGTDMIKDRLQFLFLKAAGENDFYRYLITKILHSYYAAEKDEAKEESSVDVILDIAAKGCLSAVATKGIWAAEKRYRYSDSKKDNFNCLVKAARNNHPDAIRALGECYRKGLLDTETDADKAGYFEKLYKFFQDSIEIL